MNWLKITAALLVVAALAAGVWKIRHDGIVAGRAEIQAQWDKMTAIANENAREQERMNRASKEKALEAQKKALTQNIVAADRARATADGLRADSERSLQTARENHAACVISATAHAELLGRCEQRYRRVAEKAQGHATDVRALLESWPK